MQKMALLVLLVLGTGLLSFGIDGKPIVIITQDGEVDDRSSFIRFLLHTPDIDLRGVIATNSKWQKNGHGLGWINEAYGLYDQVLDNLLLHNPDYPSVEYLQSITVLGNEDSEHLTGSPPYADSKGADLIIKELLSLEDNLLHINCWGGVNTVAHALWKFRKKFPAEFKKKAPKKHPELPRHFCVGKNAGHVAQSRHKATDPRSLCYCQKMVWKRMLPCLQLQMLPEWGTAMPSLFFVLLNLYIFAITIKSG